MGPEKSCSIVIRGGVDGWLPEAGKGVCKMGEGDQKVQSSSYKINKLW